MSCNLDEIVADLRRRGWRLTPQRQVLLELLHKASGHIDAESLWQELRARFPAVSLSTVYRTLESLRDMGAATETDMGHGRIQYHLASHGRHHHLVCRKCGAVEDIADELLEPLRREIESRTGFQLDVNHLALRGVCARCS
ncbi:MAG: Fur family transcriptional regulator [Armatimonadota bacterium]